MSYCCCLVVVGVRSVILSFPDKTHLLFGYICCAHASLILVMIHSMFHHNFLILLNLFFVMRRRINKKDSSPVEHLFCCFNNTIKFTIK